MSPHSREELEHMDLLNKAWVEVKNNDESEVIIEFLNNMGGGCALRYYGKA